MENVFNEFAISIAKEVAKILDVEGKTISKQNEQKVQPIKLLNTKEASELYGVHINTIRNWIGKGEIKSKRVGNRLYVFVESNILDDEKRR